MKKKAEEQKRGGSTGAVAFIYFPCRHESHLKGSNLTRSRRVRWPPVALVVFPLASFPPPSPTTCHQTAPFRYTHLNDAALHFSFPILCFYLPAIVAADLFLAPTARLIYSRTCHPAFRVCTDLANNGAGCISAWWRFFHYRICYQILFPRTTLWLKRYMTQLAKILMCDTDNLLIVNKQMYLIILVTFDRFKFK